MADDGHSPSGSISRRMLNATAAAVRVPVAPLNYNPGMSRNKDLNIICIGVCGGGWVSKAIIIIFIMTIICRIKATAAIKN